MGLFEAVRGLVGIIVSFLGYRLDIEKHNKEIEKVKKALKSKILDTCNEIDSVLHDNLQILHDRQTLLNEITKHYASKLGKKNMDIIQNSIEKIQNEIDKINTYIENNEKFTKSLLDKKNDCVEDKDFEKEYEIKKYELHNYKLLFKNYRSAHQEVQALLKEYNFLSGNANVTY
jgi:hypothetical protein